MSTAMSWASVMVVWSLTDAATVTKRARLTTHTAIDVISRLVGRVFVTNAVRSDAKTRAITPTGCTTMSGANASAPSCTRIATPNRALPTSHTGSRSSPHASEAPMDPEPAAVRAATPRDCRWLPSVSSAAETIASTMPRTGKESMVMGPLRGVAEPPRYRVARFRPGLASAAETCDRCVARCTRRPSL